MEAAEKQVLSLTEELLRVWTTHVQKVLVCSNKVEVLEVQLVSTHKKR